MPESFGARLRQRREREGIALSTIADQTKIKLALLEALERDDVSSWPSGIFRRAFLRAYAHAIGLEPDVVVREFLDIHPDPDEVVATVSSMATLMEADSAGPPTRLRQMVGSAIGSLARLRPRAAMRPNAPAVPTERDTVSIPETPERFGPVMDESWCDDAGVPTPQSEASVRTDPPAHFAPSSDRSADLRAVQIAPAEEPMVLDPIPAEDAVGRVARAAELLEVARVCTELGRVGETRDVAPLLQDAAGVLGAVGLIVWIWDPIAAELVPVLAYGYSETVLAQLPRVGADAGNATAAAFRSSQACTVNGSGAGNGALVVPLMTAAGCAGVLAAELPDGREASDGVRALATIFAAQFAALMGAAIPAEAAGRRLA